MRALALSVCTVLLLVGHALSKNILVLLPMPGYSHTMPFMPIFKELGRRGHNVTMVTPFPQEPTPKGFNQITVPVTIADMTKRIWGSMGTTPQPGTMNSPLFHLIGASFFCPVVTKFVLESVKPYYPPPESNQYDLVITEPFFCMEPLLAASHVYNAPVVATLPMPLTAAAASAMGNPQEFSYVPTGKMACTDKMTFLERTWNTFTAYTDLLVTYIYYYPAQDKFMREYVPFDGLPYIRDLMKNISLTLTLTHFSMNYQRPYARNVLEVAGVSTSTVNPLPENLEKFYSEAKDGVILFSWGSHFQAEDVDDILKSLMTTFSKIKQRVLFKWAHDIPYKPDNVLIQKWLPQPSILDHNKTVAFISHCGLNSIYEAAYFGVPVIGTALFGDQAYNIKMLENFGMAIGIDVNDLRTQNDVLLAAINEITTDQSYKENALKRRVMLRDRPMPPLQEAVYWIEYVMKYGGDHLQPAAKFMSWYNVALLDVGAFIIGIVGLVVYVLCKSFCFCVSKCRGSKCAKKNVSKNKKRN